MARAWLVRSILGMAVLGQGAPPPGAAAAPATTVAAPAGSPAPPVRLVPADSTAAVTVKGTLRGRVFRDFLLAAGAGQEFVVELNAANPSANFNVLPPGSSAAAMFSGSVSGSRFEGTAPIAGDYIVRVYLVRSAARRNESSTFAISAQVTGTALVPLPDSIDALVPGTPFHAAGRVSCRLPYQPEVRECDARVIRYAHDGTATVELLGPNGFVRRILFVRGVPGAADALEPPTFTRRDDTTTVRIGSAERYDLPDALVTGG